MKKTKTLNTINKELYNALITATVATEKHCSYDGKHIIITGNTSKLDERELANSAVLDPDQFLWLKHIRYAFNLSLDHSNGYEDTKDRNGNNWIPRRACLAFDNKGIQHHYFLTTLLKEYPGKGNWSIILK